MDQAGTGELVQRLEDCLATILGRKQSFSCRQVRQPKCLAPDLT